MSDVNIRAFTRDENGETDFEMDDSQLFAAIIELYSRLEPTVQMAALKALAGYTKGRLELTVTD